jgi:hypothetical protein
MPIVPQDQQGLLSSGTGLNYLFDSPRVGDTAAFTLVVSGEAVPMLDPNFTLPGIPGIAWSLNGESWGADGASLPNLYITAAGLTVHAKCVSAQANALSLTIDSSGLIEDQLGNVYIQAPTLPLILTVLEPMVTASSPSVTIQTPTLALTMSYPVPSVTSIRNTAVESPVLSLSISTHAPVVETSATDPNVVVDVPVVSLTISTHIPTVTTQLVLGRVLNLITTPGDAQVGLSWDAVPNRQYYRIERATNSIFTAGVVTLSTNTTLTTFMDTNSLVNGTTYWYRVRATASGYIDGAWSEHKSATPVAAPTALTDGTYYLRDLASGITGAKALSTTNGTSYADLSYVVGPGSDAKTYYRWVVVNASTGAVAHSGSWVAGAASSPTGGLLKSVDNAAISLTGVEVEAGERLGIEVKGTTNGTVGRWVFADSGLPETALRLTVWIIHDYDEDYEDYTYQIVYNLAPQDGGGYSLVVVT